LPYFFKVTLDRRERGRCLSTINHPRNFRFVLSPEEVERFLEAAPGIRYKSALSALYGAARSNEIASLKVSDIESKRTMPRIEQGESP
jgi:integrase/recombinase XerD